MHAFSSQCVFITFIACLSELAEVLRVCVSGGSRGLKHSGLCLEQDSLSLKPVLLFASCSISRP